MNKHLKTLLVISILANLFLAGVLAGGALRPHGPPFGHRPPPLAKEMEELPAPAREKLRTALEEIQGAYRDLKKDIRASRQETLRILEAEPFDEAAYRAAMQRLTDLRQQKSAQMAEMVLNVARELPADQRKLLAQALRKPPPPPPGPGGPNDPPLPSQE